MVLLFSLTNAPITYMCLLNGISSEYLNHFILVFLDDILIYSKSEDEHEEHLKLVLQVLREHQMNAKLRKWNFYQKKV